MGLGESVRLGAELIREQLIARRVNDKCALPYLQVQVTF